MTNSKNRTAAIHIAVRSGKYGEQALNADPVEEHNRIAQKEGRALFGKLGRTPDRAKLELIRDYIRNGARVNLILVRRSGAGFLGFAAPMYDIHTDYALPRLSLVPEYYRDLAPEIPLWFEVGVFSLMKKQELDRMVLASNGKSLTSVLAICRTSVMLVKEKA